MSDLTDWEYSSDGKRMCFINFKTGERVYHEDQKFHILKSHMLTNTPPPEKLKGTWRENDKDLYSHSKQHYTDTKQDNVQQDLRDSTTTNNQSDGAVVLIALIVGGIIILLITCACPILGGMIFFGGLLGRKTLFVQGLEWITSTLEYMQAFRPPPRPWPTSVPPTRSASNYTANNYPVAEETKDAPRSIEILTFITCLVAVLLIAVLLIGLNTTDGKIPISSKEGALSMPIKKVSLDIDNNVSRDEPDSSYKQLVILIDKYPQFRHEHLHNMSNKTLLHNLRINSMSEYYLRLKLMEWVRVHDSGQTPSTNIDKGLQSNHIQQPPIETPSNVVPSEKEHRDPYLW